MTDKYIIISNLILSYINSHKAFFENTTPKIGEKWWVEQEVTYPNVNYGRPVVEVINEKGEWMRLPKYIVNIQK